MLAVPSILHEVNSLHAATERNLADLGGGVPADDASKAALLQNVVASFAREYVGALVEKRADIKTGRRIKECFVGMHGALKQVAPFSGAAFSDEALLEAVRDCEGNHLSFPIPPIELLEHMLTHPEKRPVRQLLPPLLGCLAQVQKQAQRGSPQSPPHLPQSPHISLNFPTSPSISSNLLISPACQGPG